MRWAIEAEDLTVAYADQPVLWDVDAQVPADGRERVLKVGKRRFAKLVIKASGRA